MAILSKIELNNLFLKMSQKESFGIMDDCYFVPRTEILDWINNLLHVHVLSFSLI